MLWCIVVQVCDVFDDDYWSECDCDVCFFEEFYVVMVECGVFGIVMFIEYGGMGVGIIEVFFVMYVIVNFLGGQSVVFVVYINIFGLYFIVCFGIEEQCQCFFFDFIEGWVKICFGVIELNVGFDIMSIIMCVVCDGDVYCVNGWKIWMLMVQEVGKIMLLVCIMLKEECE